MTPKLSKENVELAYAQFARLFNNFFPGIVILELFFNRGYFSTQPDTIFELVLFLLWAGIFSIPFYYIQPAAVVSLAHQYFEKEAKKNGVTSEELQESLENNLNDEDKLVLKNANEVIELGFVLIKLVLLYMSYKVFSYYCPKSFSFLGIGPEIVGFAISYFATYIISIVVARPYRYFVFRGLRSLFSDD